MKKLLIIPLILWSLNSWAITATFQEGVSSYTGTSDATIVSASTNEHITDNTQFRFTDAGYLYVLGFDISSIPTTATVSSATVTLQVSEQNCTAETGVVRAIENPDNSSMFDDNEAAADVFNDYATWAYKDHGSTIDWDATASNNFADVDDNANADTEALAACAGFVPEDWVITSMVQGWVTTPTSNAGMVFLLTDTGRVDVKNKRDATSSNRPLLSITYTTASSGTDLKIGTDFKINTDFKI